MKYFFLSLSLFLFLPLSANAYTIDTIAQQAIVVDDSTGTVLFEKNADVKMHPSSMSKVMTAYIALHDLKNGKIKMTDTFPVSERAWRMQGSKTFVEVGKQIPLDALLQGIIVQSGNDACIVLAEGLAGSEEAFAARMNSTAQELGLSKSHFVNSTGWPDEQQLMSARDLASLAKHLIDELPEYYHFFSQTEYTYHGITQQNRNPLLTRNLGVDGLKTGHTDQGGYGIAISGVAPDQRRIILVINGLPTDKARAEESERLLQHAYRDFENVVIAKEGEAVDRIPVWRGKADSVGATVEKDVILTLPKARSKNAKATLSYDGPLQAPVKRGTKIAELRIEMEGQPAFVVPLVAANDVEPLGFFARIWPNILYYFGGHK